MKTYKLFIDRKSFNPKGYDLWGFSLYDCNGDHSSLVSHSTKRYRDIGKGAVERSINCYAWGIETVAPLLNKEEDDFTLTVFITNKNVYKRLDGGIKGTYRIEMEKLCSAIDSVYGVVCIELLDVIQNKGVLTEDTVKKEKYEKITDFCGKI